MLTIIIQKKLIAKDEELIAIPRKEYEALLRSKYKNPKDIKKGLSWLRDPKKCLIIKIETY